MNQANWFHLRCEKCGDYKLITAEPAPELCLHCGKLPLFVLATASGQTTQKLPILGKREKAFSIWGPKRNNGSRKAWQHNAKSGGLREVER